MKIKLPVLDLSEVQTTMEQYKKVLEEIREFELTQPQTAEEIAEALDVIQSLTGYIMMHYSKTDIQRASIAHYNKLQSRDRKIIGNINILVEVNDNE